MLNAVRAMIRSVPTLLSKHSGHLGRNYSTHDSGLSRLPAWHPHGLHHACYQGDADVVKDVIHSTKTYTPILYAWPEDPQKTSLLLFTLSIRCGNGWTALHTACIFGHAHIAKQLLDALPEHERSEYLTLTHNKQTALQIAEERWGTNHALVTYLKQYAQPTITAPTKPVVLFTHVPSTEPVDHLDKAVDSALAPSPKHTQSQHM